MPLPPSHAPVSCQTQTETRGKGPGEHGSREKGRVTLAGPGTKRFTHPTSAPLSLEFQNLWRDLSPPSSFQHLSARGSFCVCPSWGSINSTIL